MSSSAGLSTSSSGGSSTNSILEKLGLLLVALVVLYLTRATMRFAYRHVFGPSALCRGTVDFVKCGKWAGTYLFRLQHCDSVVSFSGLIQAFDDSGGRHICTCCFSALQINFVSPLQICDEQFQF